MRLEEFERRVSHRDRERIARTLPPPVRKSVKLAVLLDNIEFVIQDYWLRIGCEFQPASRKQIASELSQLAQHAQELLGFLDSLSHEAVHALTIHFAGGLRSQHSRFFRIWHLIRCLHTAAQDFNPKGRPRQVALQIYAAQLVLVWEEATGIKVRRRYNCSRVGRQEHIPFFAECMAVAGVPKYPSFIIRQAIKENSYLRPSSRVMEKNRLRSKNPSTSNLLVIRAPEI
jgi:hypothetical protein